MWRLFKPYTLDTWLFIGVLLLLQMATFVLIEGTEWRLGFRRTFSLPSVIWRTLRMQLLQPQVGEAVDEGE
jgi:hypothetical protein